MHSKIEEACKALDDLVSLIETQTSDTNLLSLRHGWNHPSLSNKDLAAIPRSLSEALKASELDDLTDSQIKVLERINENISQLNSSTVPYF